MLHWPEPGTRRTRAIASLRRPVAALGATTAGRLPGAAEDGVASERYAISRSCSSTNGVSSSFSTVVSTVSVTVIPCYWAIWVIW